MRENQTHIGCVSYSTMVREDFYVGEYFDRDAMLPVIWDIDYMAGVTNTADGIDMMQKMFVE